MDTRFTDEELAFQQEVREFSAEALDDELRAKLEGAEASPNLKEGMEEWQRRLIAKGWTYAKSLLYRAVCTADAGDEDGRRSQLALKVMVGRAGCQIGGEAIQMHGGIGMAEELAVGFYVKRLMIASVLFGDEQYQQQKFSALVNAPVEPEEARSSRAA